MKYQNLMEVKGSRYPNLVEVIDWHICGKPAIADHAGITGELLDAVLNGKEELTHDEMRGISCLTDIPVGVLERPELVLMDSNKFQHVMKVMDLVDSLDYIKRLRTVKGRGEDIELKVAERKLNTYLRYFKLGDGSYVGYKAVKKAVDWNFWLFQNMDTKKPRGLKK